MCNCGRRRVVRVNPPPGPTGAVQSVNPSVNVETLVASANVSDVPDNVTDPATGTILRNDS